MSTEDRRLQIDMLWLYAHEVWPKLFELPASPMVADVKWQVWQDILGDLDAGLLRRAITAAASSQYPPSPGELRTLALRLRSIEANESLAPDPDEAWAEVRKAFHRVGRYGTPQWSHPALAAAVDAMGWEQLCDSPDGDPTTRAQFRGFYESARARIVAAEHPMPGLARGRETPALVRGGVPDAPPDDRRNVAVAFECLGVGDRLRVLTTLGLPIPSAPSMRPDELIRAVARVVVERGLVAQFYEAAANAQ